MQAKAADVLLRREAIALHRAVQEALDMLQFTESIPKTSRRRSRLREEDECPTLETESLTAWAVGTLKRCVKGALANDADKIEVLRNVMWKNMDFLTRSEVLHGEVGSLTLSVCTLRSLSD